MPNAFDGRLGPERFPFFHPSADRRASVPEIDGNGSEQFAFFVSRGDPDDRQNGDDYCVFVVPSFEFHLSKHLSALVIFGTFQPRRRYSARTDPEVANPSYWAAAGFEMVGNLSWMRK
jgi:hypothetical protein